MMMNVVVNNLFSLISVVLLPHSCDGLVYFQSYGEFSGCKRINRHFIGSVVIVCVGKCVGASLWV